MALKRRDTFGDSRAGEPRAAGHSEAAPLYEWNIEVSAAALSLTALVEVVLRKALDKEMRTWAVARGEIDWLAAAPLDGQDRRDVAKARARAARGRQTVTHGHVVAELNLGFWRYLLSRRYLTSLRIPALQHAFPYATGDARLTQHVLEGHAQRQLYLRNRAAHHEPLPRRNLDADLGRRPAPEAGNRAPPNVKLAPPTRAPKQGRRQQLAGRL